MPLAHDSHGQKPAGSGTNLTLFEALSHPLRYRMMMVLGERRASPKQLADLLDEDRVRIAEQIRYLRDADCIELVATETGGGAQHLYRATVRPVLDAEAWEKFPRLAREIASVQIVRRIVSDVVASVETGVFDARQHRALLSKPIRVDDQGFREADESALRHLDELTEIAARSAARLIENGQEPINVSTATLVFESAPQGLRRTP
jgi:DNA-binding transcriptional ArsR family regulator